MCLLPFWQQPASCFPTSSWFASRGGTQSLLLFPFGIVIAGGLLWSLVPRPDHFKAKGPPLERGQHPLLIGNDRCFSEFFVVDPMVQGKISREPWPAKYQELGLPAAPLFAQVPLPQQA
jgi:hypothetical protein